MLRRLFGGRRSAQEEFARGTAAAQAGRMAEGIVALRSAVELKPDFPEAHYNRGAAHRDVGNADAALAAYRRAAELVPKFADVHVDIASLLRERRELEQAEQSLNRALALRPAFPEALLELGNVHKGAGDWRAAVEDFRRAVSLAPTFGRARWALAVAQIPMLDDGETDREERRQAFARELGALEAWTATDPQAFRAVAEQQPFYLAYHEVSNRDLLARYGKLCALLMQGWQLGAGLEPPRRGGRGKPERLKRDSTIRGASRCISSTSRRSATRKPSSRSRSPPRSTTARAPGRTGRASSTAAAWTCSSIPRSAWTRRPRNSPACGSRRSRRRAGASRRRAGCRPWTTIFRHRRSSRRTRRRTTARRSSCFPVRVAGCRTPPTRRRERGSQHRISPLPRCCCSAPGRRSSTRPLTTRCSSRSRVASPAASWCSSAASPKRCRSASSGACGRRSSERGWDSSATSPSCPGSIRRPSRRSSAPPTSTSIRSAFPASTPRCRRCAAACRS